MSEKKIQLWKKVGEPSFMAKKFGKQLIVQMFLNPTTGKEEEFVLFGQKDWSVVLPVTEDGEVVVVRQYKQGCHQILLELPAGTADFKDETPEEVMRRELLEETGYEPAEVIALGPSQYISTRNSWTRFHPFLARGCRKVKETKIDLNEEIEVILIPLEEWIDLCLKEIVEPSAIVATFRSLPHLGYQFQTVSK